MSLALVAAACTGSADDGSTTTSPSPGTTEPSSPGTTLPQPPAVGLSTATLNELTTTNIWSAYGEGATVFDALVLAGQPAFLYTLGHAGTAAPLISAAPEIPTGSEQGGNWVIEVPLREGLAWSDRTPLTAIDVAFTFDTVQRLGLGGSLESLWANPSLLSVEADGDHRVVLTWSRQPGLAEWQYGTALAPILPEHHWSFYTSTADSPPDLYEVSGIGAPGFGPTVPTSHEAEVAIRTESNASYPYRGASYTVYGNGSVEFSHPVIGQETWGGSPSGEPVLTYSERYETSDLTFDIHASQDRISSHLLDGEIDFWLNPLAMWRELGGIKRQFAQSGDLTVGDTVGSGVVYLAFNTRRFPGNSLAFRRAVDCMVDKAFLTSEIAINAVTPLDTMVPPAADGWHNEDTDSTCNLLSQESRINSAIEILLDAGWTWEERPYYQFVDGIDDVEPGKDLRGPNGEVIPPIELFTPTPSYDPIRATYALWIQVYMSELGVPITTVPVPPEYLSETINSLDWDVYVYGTELTNSLPAYLVEMFHSNGDLADGGLNTSGYSSGLFDPVAEEFATSADSEAAMELAHSMQDILARDVPYIPLYTNPVHHVYRDVDAFPFEDFFHVFGRGLPGLRGRF